MINDLSYFKLLLHYGIIIVYNSNSFDYDPIKSSTNKLKHGIDFETAKKLWLDANLLELDLVSGKEKRFMAIAQINKRFWSAIITYRYDRIRIISVRRSRKKEMRLYEKNHSGRT